MGSATTHMEEEPSTTVTVDTTAEDAPTVETSSDEDADTMSYFEKLAEKG